MQGRPISRVNSAAWEPILPYSSSTAEVGRSERKTVSEGSKREVTSTQP